MLDEIPKDVINPAAPSPANPNTPVAPVSPAPGSDIPAGKPGEEPMIPKSRFDEAVAKAQADAQKVFQAEIARNQAEFEARMASASAALGGRAPNAPEIDPEIQKLGETFGVQPEFLDAYSKVLSARQQKDFQKQLQPMQQVTTETLWLNELNKLKSSVPEAAHLSQEEADKLRAMAFEPRYQQVPIDDLYKIANYGRPKGKSGVEVGRGGGRAATDPDAMPDIANMTPAEFAVFSAELAKRG